MKKNVRRFGISMDKTNFDHYLEEQMKDPAFAARFERAGETWAAALTASVLRDQAYTKESKGEANRQGDDKRSASKS